MNIEQYYDDVFRFILPYVSFNKAEAYDVCQNTMLKALIKKDLYKEDNLKLWLFAIAKNSVFDRKRHLKRYPHEEFADTVKTSDNTLEDWDLTEKDTQIKMLKKAYKMLSENQREVIDYHYTKGYSFKEISELNDESIGTSLGKMRYAKKNLKHIFTLFEPIKKRNKHE